MSLVGTRPPTVDEWDKYELHHRARLATKPGLTGMWQVSGRSNITDLCLDNHSNLLKDYVKLLALASASVLVCLDDDQGIYQQAAQNLQQYINASQRPGKKQTDFSDLFVYQEYAHDYALYDIYRENQVPGRRCKLLKDMERIFDETHNADIYDVSGR